MSKEQFRKVRLSKGNMARLEDINEIIKSYQCQGYVLTLRQLYYQLVSRDIIPNKLAEYSKLSTLLKEGRMGWIVDWNAIEDRLRQPYIPYSVDDIEDAIDDTVKQYRLDRMLGQDTYIEVWVEKDALSGVLKRITKKYHINILVNRGYSSASAMFDAYNRFDNALARDKSSVRILYLGDFDPSGLDMIRDIDSRIREFFAPHARFWDVGDYLDFEIVPIALTREQINQYNPPPNPAKRTDPRAANFIRDEWTTSWEVDALKPEILNQILEDAILENLDLEQYENMLAKEQAERTKIAELRNFL